MASKFYSSEKTKEGAEARAVALDLERIQIAKKDQDQWADHSGAKRFVKEYKGDYGLVFQGRTKKIPVPPINEVFAYVQSDIATTYNRDPYITVNAEAGTVKGAALWEVILNYWWRKLKTKEEIEYEIIDKDVVGFAWHKVGHAVTSSGTGETLKIDSETLYSRWVSWRDITWNIGSKRPPYDCQWMAQRIVKPLEWVKTTYPAAKGLEGVVNPDVEEDTFKKSTYKDDIKVAVLHEIWDAKKKEIRLVAEGLKDRYLAPPKPWPDHITEFPFLMYWDFAIPDSSRPMSAIAPWEAQILEEMILMAQAINHSKRWNRQAFVNSATFEEESLDKYERGDDGAIIRVNGKVGAEDLRLVDYGQLPTDFYLLMDRLQAIKRNINGQPEFVRGGVTKTNTRTIGELQLMQQGTKGRQDRKMDRLETHCENIARHMMANLKANFDFEEVVKITGEVPEEVIAALGPNVDPVTGAVKFTPEEIKGEYDVEIKSGSTLPLDKQTKMQVYEIAMNTVAQASAAGPVSNLLVACIEGLLEGYDMKGLKEAYEKDLVQAEQAQAKADQEGNIEAEKVKAEAMKRMAQAGQVQAETAIIAQDAEIGPIGRAAMKKFEKPDPKPVANGSSK